MSSLHCAHKSQEVTASGKKSISASWLELTSLYFKKITSEYVQGTHIKQSRQVENGSDMRT
jgi:hypothetical protein